MYIIDLHDLFFRVSLSPLGLLLWTFVLHSAWMWLRGEKS